MTTPALPHVFDQLAERDLIAQTTSPDLRARLSTPVTAYIGFDPTADSLHVGSLVPMMALRRLQAAGHKPLVVVGGATALVGDPSGKSEARRMLTREQVTANAQAISAQIGRVVRFGSDATGAELLDNADWLAGLTWIDLLRSVGPHFSVNRMLSMDSVKGRLEGGGISFLEFNYMVMQAYDFAHLFRTRGCTLQLGGSDQWGNIVMGIELARRQDGAELQGLTMPLVTRSDGGKFGKSEAGNIWLSAERTPVHDFYQFWRNTADADVARFLGYFTDLPKTEILALCHDGGAALNQAKEQLAVLVTTLIHGEAAAQAAHDSARRAFSGQDATGAAIPHAPLPRTELDSGLLVIDLMVRSGLVASKGEARRLIEGGGVRIDNTRISDVKALVPKPQATDASDALPSDASPSDAGHLVLRIGKKQIFRFDLG